MVEPELKFEFESNFIILIGSDELTAVRLLDFIRGQGES